MMGGRLMIDGSSDKDTSRVVMLNLTLFIVLVLIQYKS